MTTFVIEILSPTILRSLVESVAQVLTQARFMVVKSDEFSGLRLNAMDDTTICCVNAQLSAEVTGSGEFCVSTKELLVFLKAIDSGSVIVIKGGSDLDILTIETTGHGTKVRKYELPCLICEPREWQLGDMQTVHQVDLPAHDLNQFLALCRSQKYGNVALKIHNDVGGRKYFTMSARGDAGGGAEETYVDWDTPNATVGIDSMPTTTVVTYDESFKCDFLYRFCRHAVCQTIQISLMKKEEPIVVNLNIGSDKTYIRFVLASAVQE